MKHVTLLTLLVFSPLSWGEDVYYCVEEHRVGLEPVESGDAYEVKEFLEEKFTFKYEAVSQRLAFKGRAFSSGDTIYYM